MEQSETNVVFRGVVLHRVSGRAPISDRGASRETREKEASCDRIRLLDTEISRNSATVRASPCSANVGGSGISCIVLQTSYTIVIHFPRTYMYRFIFQPHDIHSVPIRADSPVWALSFPRRESARNRTQAREPSAREACVATRRRVPTATRRPRKTREQHFSYPIVTTLNPRYRTCLYSTCANIELVCSGFSWRASRTWCISDDTIRKTT